MTTAEKPVALAYLVPVCAILLLCMGYALGLRFATAQDCAPSSSSAE